jgi:TusA-related sulfurtransferase
MITAESAGGIENGATPEPRDARLTLEALGPIARTWVGAIPAHDFGAIAAVLTPDVAFNALVPSGLREAATSEDAVAWIERWFGDADTSELLAAAEGTMADRAWFMYRFRVHEPSGWSMVEQQVYATLVDGRIERLSLVCSGFRPVEPVEGVVPGAECAARPGGRSAAQPAAGPVGPLNALGADCSTLIPTLARTMAAVPAGGVLDVLTDDPTAEASLSSWARLTGHEIVRSRPARLAGNHWYLRRKES